MSENDKLPKISDQAVEKQIEPSELFSQAPLCANCGELLDGAYCAHCGQSAKSAIKGIGELFGEVMTELVGFDSRLKHTIAPLLFRPGKITLDYLQGRRNYYVLPLRLYLISSVLLMLLMKINTNFDTSFIQFDGQENIELNSEISDKSSATPPKETNSASSTKTAATLTLDDSKDEPFWLREFEQKIQRDYPKWRQNPAPLFKHFYEALPYMMFVLLPLFALVLKAGYLFSRRFYIEHLLFLLHQHSFVFTGMIVQLGLWSAAASLKNTEMALAHNLSEIFNVGAQLLALWMVIYVLLAMKRVYRQGWALTLFKFFGLGIIYVMMLSVGFVITLAVSVYQL